MTQVIGVLTRRSVLLACDRRLTSIATGKVIHDDTCKMVSLCNTAGIAYTGLAQLDGIPTHEWICHRLADANVARAGLVLPVLMEAATRSFSTLSSSQLFPHSFLLAGYERFQDESIRPMLGDVTNMRDIGGRLLPSPGRTFVGFRYVQQPEQRIYSTAAGVPLADARHAALVRNLGRAYSRETSDEPLLRLLADTIVTTARKETDKVGERVLTMAIPLRSVMATHPFRAMVAGPASNDVATFGYM